MQGAREEKTTAVEGKDDKRKREGMGFTGVALLALNAEQHLSLLHSCGWIAE